MFGCDLDLIAQASGSSQPQQTSAKRRPSPVSSSHPTSASRFRLRFQPPPPLSQLGGHIYSNSTVQTDDPLLASHHWTGTLNQSKPSGPSPVISSNPSSFSFTYHPASLLLPNLVRTVTSQLDCHATWCLGQAAFLNLHLHLHLHLFLPFKPNRNGTYTANTPLSQQPTQLLVSVSLGALSLYRPVPYLCIPLRFVCEPRRPPAVRLRPFVPPPHHHARRPASQVAHQDVCGAPR